MVKLVAVRSSDIVGSLPISHAKPKLPYAPLKVYCAAVSPTYATCVVRLDECDSAIAYEWRLRTTADVAGVPDSAGDTVMVSVLMFVMSAHSIAPETATAISVPFAKREP